MNCSKNLIPALEAELVRQSAELSDPLRDVCHYALTGGRRTRAKLLLSAVSRNEPCVILAASALELLHAATLLQDDIFDAGDLRRGRVAAHVRFGKPLTILASDWLLIRALELAADVDPRFFRCLAQAGIAMAQAEAGEFAPLTLPSLDDAQSYGAMIARGKTAALFGTALCGAAVLLDMTPAECARWEQIGVQMGLTYQMVDDCVDLYGVETRAGKTLGHDLVAGCFTTPVLLAARSLEEDGVGISLEHLQAGRLPAAELLRLRQEAHSSRTVAKVLDLLHIRFATHRQEAECARLSVGVLGAWQSDLVTRLDPRFREGSSLLREQPQPSPRRQRSSASWQPNA